MTKKIRIIATLLAIIFFFVVLCSALFVIHGADHDCIGERCAICNCINLFEELQRIITLASGIFLFANLFLLPLLFYTSCWQKNKSQDTPIKLKVKLLN